MGGDLHRWGRTHPCVRYPSPLGPHASLRAISFALGPVPSLRAISFLPKRLLFARRLLDKYAEARGSSPSGRRYNVKSAANLLGPLAHTGNTVAAFCCPDGLTAGFAIL